MILSNDLRCVAVSWKSYTSLPVCCLNIFAISFSFAAIPASSGPSQPDYNRRMKPWRASGNFDHVDVSRMGEPCVPSPAGGAAYRPVSFKSPSSNFGAFNGAPSSSQVPNSNMASESSAPAPIPVGGSSEGYSDL